MAGLSPGAKPEDPFSFLGDCLMATFAPAIVDNIPKAEKTVAHRSAVWATSAMPVFLIPDDPNYAAIDAALLPNTLFQASGQLVWFNLHWGVRGLTRVTRDRLATSQLSGGLAKRKLAATCEELSALNLIVQVTTKPSRVFDPDDIALELDALPESDAYYMCA